MKVLAIIWAVLVMIKAFGLGLAVVPWWLMLSPAFVFAGFWLIISLVAIIIIIIEDRD